ncbi:MAG TPA: methionyl-tRNA formyltransferase [Spirochaetota bacterium]|nr:methionyl-tRNA formyltransferase [Spirochaetota bacterium]HOL57668.1 methionyl-tRNA formyltransferase [Spirochaetota bacterium]HPP04758.1 methionyl-tRNA formyltransferase [Spirochaetota bacterium]
MRILFLGTSDIGVEVLQNLNKNFEVVAVLTQTDKPLKRSSKPVPTPIAIEAEKLNLKLYKAEKISSELIEDLKKYSADIFVTFAYGIILKKDFFDVAKFGGINIHPSLLPELRGPSPIQTAILQGKTKSGITIQKVALKVDSGDILLQREFEIKEEDDANSIEELVKTLASEMIVEVISYFDNIKPLPQDEEKATYCRMFKKEDGLIDWTNESGREIFNKIRAFVKWPIAHTHLDDKVVNIYKAKIENEIDFSQFKDNKNGEIVIADIKKGLIVKTKDSLLRLEMLQLEGKKILDYKNFINGQRNLKNKIFQ